LNNHGGTVQAALNMLATNGKVNVLSSPHVMVADNQTAKIQVGDSIPITTQTINTASTFTSNSTSYLDTGVMLSVTPRINAGGLVNLDIEQEFSVPGALAAGATAPPISKRSAKTKMTAQSGETMVLGGMISEKSTNNSSGLPFLSAIPVLGGLFGTTDRTTTKTELIVLITPRVANNVGQAKAISDELRRKMGEAKDLADCGVANLVGYTSRGGLWCIQPGRFEGAIDRMNEVDADGQPLYIKQRPSLPPENFSVPHPRFQKADGKQALAPLPSDPVPIGQPK
jgi:type II secretory pathway component GspD/PulD (secretin)